MPALNATAKVTFSRIVSRIPAAVSNQRENTATFAARIAEGKAEFMTSDRVVSEEAKKAARAIMSRMSTTNIPYIDPNVQHVGISRLRSLNATQLREIDKTLVIQENDQPLAVLLKYEEFLIMQQKLMSVLDTISVMADDAELAGIMAGLKEMNGGQTKSITEIRATLKTKKEKV